MDLEEVGSLHHIYAKAPNCISEPVSPAHLRNIWLPPECKQKQYFASNQDLKYLHGCTQGCIVSGRL